LRPPPSCYDPFVQGLSDDLRSSAARRSLPQAHLRNASQQMHNEIAEAIQAYLLARRKLFEVAEKYPAEMRGNDNIIGRIGEYFALQFLRSKGRFPTKTKSLSQAGFDLEEGAVKISVKLLTSENASGRGARLKDPWDEFLLIQISTSDLSGTVGLIAREQFTRAREENETWGANPIVKSSMLGENGLFGKYGTTETVAGFL
jgi:hypothetical protein